jgi:hypothetical protein
MKGGDWQAQYAEIRRVNNHAKEAGNAVVCNWGDEPPSTMSKKYSNCSKTPRSYRPASESK